MPSHRLQYAPDRAHVGCPVGFLQTQLAAAGRRELVEARLAVVLRNPPFPRDEPTLLQPVQGRVERPLFNQDVLFRAVLDPLRDRVAVECIPAERFEDEQFECALQQLCAAAHSAVSLSRLWVPIPTYKHLRGKVKKVGTNVSNALTGIVETTDRRYWRCSDGRSRRAAAQR